MSKPQQQADYQAVIQSPLPGGHRLGIRMHTGSLEVIDYLDASSTVFVSQAEGVERVVSSLQHYFSDAGTNVDVPLQPTGTPFQQRVWQRLREIPLGQVVSYGALARELGSSARAVAGACRANPVPILIPCHRVVAANGPGGYMGETDGEALAIKQWLLQHEGHV